MQTFHPHCRLWGESCFLHLSSTSCTCQKPAFQVHLHRSVDSEDTCAGLAWWCTACTQGAEAARTTLQDSLSKNKRKNLKVPMPFSICNSHQCENRATERPSGQDGIHCPIRGQVSHCSPVPLQTDCGLDHFLHMNQANNVETLSCHHPVSLQQRCRAGSREWGGGCTRIYRVGWGCTRI